MHTTAQILDLVRNAQDWNSDYKIAKHLGFSTQRVSAWRVGKATPDETACLELANLSGLAPGYVVACVHAERCTDPERRKVWEAIANTMKGAAAAVVLGITAITGATLPVPAQADEARSMYFM